MKVFLALALIQALYAHGALKTNLYIDPSSSEPFSCISQRTELQCKEKSLSCEWMDSHCEIACPSLTSASTCYLFDKCEWSLLNGCSKTDTLCYRYDDETECKRQHFCEWDNDNRTCYKLDPPPAESNQGSCSFYVTQYSCLNQLSCFWENEVCVENSKLSTTASPTVSANEAIVTKSEPSEPTETRGNFCANILSEDACRISFGRGYTCVFTEGRCVMVFELIPVLSDQDTLLPNSLLWPLLCGGVSSFFIVLGVLIKILGQGTSRRFPLTFRLFQLVLTAIGLCLISITRDDGFIVAILFASFSFTYQLCTLMMRITNLQAAFDISLFLSVIPATTSLSYTRSAQTLAGMALLVFSSQVCSFVGYSLLNFSPISHLKHKDALVNATLRITAIMISILLLVLGTEILPMSVFVRVCVVIVLINQSLMIGLLACSLPPSWPIVILDSVSAIVMTIGSTHACLNLRDHAVSICSILLLIMVCLAGMLTSSAMMFETKLGPAKISQPSSKAVIARRSSPTKQKVFATPMSSQIELREKQEQNAKMQIETETTFLGLVYLERSLESSLNMSSNQEYSPRRRGSSVEYKREMAMV